MTKKYRELPAFEINEFKVGDRIRVYDSRVSHEAWWIVYAIDEAWVHTECDGVIYSYYFQQCRKLEEVKPREFLLFRDKEGRYGSGVSFDGPRCLLVREVLEDE